MVTEPRHHFVSLSALLALAACGHAQNSAPASSASAPAPAPAVVAPPAVAVQAPTPVAAAPAPLPPAPPPGAALDEKTRSLLTEWFSKVGEPKEGESFGELIVRAARLQLGKPYFLEPEDGGAEALRVDLSRFECVSLVESSLAVARCTWLHTRDADCFAREITASRYRGGVMAGYASRLHYFSDWIDDNAARGHVLPMTAALGGTKVHQPFNYMTTHPEFYPQLKVAETREQIVAVEARLSAEDHIVLDRNAIAAAEPLLQPGDVLALVSTRKPGLLVGHVGLIDKSSPNRARLLHASGYHGRVIIQSDRISTYVLRWPDRRGIAIARPIPPALPSAPPVATAAGDAAPTAATASVSP